MYPDHLDDMRRWGIIICQDCYQGHSMQSNQLINQVGVPHLQCLHELPGTRSCNRTQVVDKVSLGHSNPCIADRQTVVILVGDHFYLELLLRLKYRWIGQTLIADLVQGLETSAMIQSKNITPYTRVRLPNQ